MDIQSVRKLWSLDPAVDFLNHGSFGACPIAVLERQSELRAELEREPVDFLTKRHGTLLDGARHALAAFLGCAINDLVFVTNATTGVNTVLNSLHLGDGDEVLVTDHIYNACRNALEYYALGSGAALQVAPIGLPIQSDDDIVDALMSRVSQRTRLVLLDHVTSVTALIMPLQVLVPALQSQGAMVLVDGAHGPGMLPLELDDIGADFYTGNCHKWLCSPKGTAFLHIREDHHDLIHPLTISHGWNTPRAGHSRLHDLFDWTGTADITALAAIPTAIEMMGNIHAGGWSELMQRNHALAVDARRVLLEQLGTEPLCAEDRLGAMASVRLPQTIASTHPHQGQRRRLYEDLRASGFEAPIMDFPNGSALLRLSAQAYNSIDQFERLAEHLSAVLVR
ncbi:MAG: aminotransferase class V-fold PLP-dependent enzyme [Chromatiales bacterium]|jgi:isopenicillin-N epimerase|nr:aminotransferase class V-fold PLP-dependent enzyme [Chromatiales bacterium]